MIDFGWFDFGRKLSSLFEHGLGFLLSFSHNRAPCGSQPSSSSLPLRPSMQNREGERRRRRWPKQGNRGPVKGLTIVGLKFLLTIAVGREQRRRAAPFASLIGTGVKVRHLQVVRSVSFNRGKTLDTLRCCGHPPHLSQTTQQWLWDALVDFLNLGISLVEIWEAFSASDSRFAELAPHLVGARVLRQDPLECLIQFLCSSNNNIGRITKMVDFVSALGARLGTVEGLDFYEFPSLDRLALVSEEEFRAAGFGYRAKYIVGTVEALQSKPGGGAKWLASLRDLDLCDVIEALSTLPGVGPKVAACIALFSLDQHHAVPVDTHVWQVRAFLFSFSDTGVQLTPKLCNRVAEAFVTKYGKYAGWAQTVLFIAELPSQKGLLPSPSVTTKKTKTIRRKNKGTTY
ncbi:hypothetical protein Scep_002664 [Stephania cephalantha]|uniref:DNA-(apurinic or apyrimidinic site) lyase n=1 Tax=Stephania cephalantha TaxID=152367 RepID=A0AAP0LAD9_9MAGN